MSPQATKDFNKVAKTFFKKIRGKVAWKIKIVPIGGSLWEGSGGSLFERPGYG